MSLSLAVFGLSATADRTPAQAIEPGLISAAAAPTWQTNAPVLTTVFAGGVLYAGGTFTSVRPPGAAPGTGEVVRTGLAAFDAATGDLLPFNPTITPLGSTKLAIRALTVSPDGATLFVGGHFGAVNGLKRTDLASFRTSDRSLTGWHPTLSGGVVYGIGVATDGTVYFGGVFGSVGGQSRTNAAAVTGNGVLLPWAPTSNGVVRTLLVSPNQSEVVIGGSFTIVNGRSHVGVIAVDRSGGGAIGAWGAGPQYSDSFEVWQMTGDAAHVYITGVDLHGTIRFEGVASLNWTDGSTVWASKCKGDTKGVALLNGVIYSASHAHDCSAQPGGFPEANINYHLLAQRASDGLILPWLPNTNYGNRAGQTGPTYMATDGTSVAVAGEFTTVNGKRQQGLVRFLPAPDQTVPSSLQAPIATALSATAIQVQFRASWDMDDGTLSYKVYREGTVAPVGGVSADSRSWSRPTLTVTDNSPPPGTHRYKVTASDGTLTTPKSPWSNSVDAGSPPATYEDAVLQSGPSSYWRLDEPSGATAADKTGNGNTGQYSGGVTYGQAGALSGDSDSAVRFDGSAGNAAATRSSNNPTSYSVEFWFNTTTSRGGKLVGFGNRQTGSSTSYDRHVYLADSGQLIFGAYPGRVVTVSSSNTYRDGLWHQAVATMGSSGMVLYVDGAAVGSDPNTVSQNYSGYWRAGGDSMGTWPSRPSSNYFAGALDEVAIYTYALTSSQVAAHYAAGT